MNALLLYTCLVMLLLGAFLVRCYLLVVNDLAAAITARDQLEGWMHASLHAIRMRAAIAFPEAVSVCTSLEMALPERDRVDVDGLVRHLWAIRRRHNATLVVDRTRDVERVRDMLAQIAVAAGAAGVHGIEAHALAALKLMRGGEAARQRESAPATAES